MKLHDLQRAFGRMKIGGPTADSRMHFNGSLSNDEFSLLQRLLYEGVLRDWCDTHDDPIYDVGDKDHPDYPFSGPVEWQCASRWLHETECVKGVRLIVKVEQP